MTNYPATLSSYTGDDAGFPGAAPNGAQMQGNPQVPSDLPQQNLPGNQNTSAQLLPTQISNGNISANSVPTNVNTAPGTDSLLAQLSRGQVLLTDTVYGQSAYIPGNAGAGNVNNPPTQPVVTRVASGVSYPATQQNHTGN